MDNNSSIKSKKVKVLLVDDSILFRETLAKELAQDSGIEIIATAGDAYEARDKIIDYEPAVMVLDVELPKMSGIEFLKRLMPQYPMPVVVISSIAENVFDALKAGAVDFVSKPNVSAPKSIDALVKELVIKIKIASTAKVGHWKNESYTSNITAKVNTENNNRIIAIGASTGGTEAIYSVVKMFPRDMPGIVIVQHMPAGFTKMYAERLNNSCLMEVKEAQDGDLILPGRVLLGAGDYHMTIKKTGSTYSVECKKGEKVNGHCPSVDVLFESVAEKIGKNAIGMILTGMGADGAKGLLSMKNNGARTIGQDENSCIVYGMPKVAYDIGAVEKQAPLNDIPRLVFQMLSEKPK